MSFLNKSETAATMIPNAQTEAKKLWADAEQKRIELHGVVYKVRLPNSMIDQIKYYADHLEVSICELVNTACRRLMKENYRVPEYLKTEKGTRNNSTPITVRIPKDFAASECAIKLAVQLYLNVLQPYVAQLEENRKEEQEALGRAGVDYILNKEQ